jgi:hypothetical protein
VKEDNPIEPEKEEELAALSALSSEPAQEVPRVTFLLIIPPWLAVLWIPTLF